VPRPLPTKAKVRYVALMSPQQIFLKTHDFPSCQAVCTPRQSVLSQ